MKLEKGSGMANLYWEDRPSPAKWRQLVRKALRKHGKVESLAKACGVSERSIYRWCSTKSKERPRLGHYLAIKEEAEKGEIG